MGLLPAHLAVASLDRLVLPLLRCWRWRRHDVQEAKEEEGRSKASASTSTIARTSCGATDACLHAACHDFFSDPIVLHGCSSNNHSLCSTNIRGSGLCCPSDYSICCSCYILHRLRRLPWYSSVKCLVRHRRRQVRMNAVKSQRARRRLSARFCSSVGARPKEATFFNDSMLHLQCCIFAQCPRLSVS